MPSSMTGFARQESQHTWGTLACELRSVNHRYLEPAVRLPETLRIIEPQLRELLRKRLSRGKIEASLFIKTESSEDAQLGLNDALAGQIIRLAEKLNPQISEPAKFSALDILRWPGVIRSAEIDADELQKAATDLFSTTLAKLTETRAREGIELRQMIEQRLDAIAEAVTKVRALLPEILEQHQQKLRSKLDSLKVDIDEDRFAQEAVYIAQKADVAEELDRLQAHLGEVRHTLQQKGPVGRRLDFLMQELNREANTLSSKSVSSDTTQVAVDIKVLIEQMREQIQNIE